MDIPILSQFIPILKKRGASGDASIQTVLLPDETLDALSLVRGVDATLDVAAAVSGARSGWVLPDDAPDFFSMDSAGVLTATPVHAQVSVPEQLTVGTDQGEVYLPLSLRDGFPSDFFTPNYFWSMLRSYNGASDSNLFQVKYRRYDSDGTETLDSDDNPVIDYVDVQSGADGYTDIAQLQADLAAFSQKGVVELYKLYNQRHASNFHFTAPANRELLMGFVESGTLDIFLENDTLPYAKSSYREIDTGTVTEIGTWTKNTQYTTSGNIHVSSLNVFVNVVDADGTDQSNFLSAISVGDSIYVASGDTEGTLKVTAISFVDGFEGDAYNLTCSSGASVVEGFSSGSEVTLGSYGSFVGIGGNERAEFSSGSGYVFNRPALVGVFRRYRHTDPHNTLGDGNNYPAWWTTSTQVKMNTYGNDSSAQLTDSFAADWFLIDAHLIDEGDGVINRSSLYKLESEESSLGTAQANNSHNAYGPIRLEFGDYDFAEAAIYNAPDGAEWQSNKDIINNLVALFGGTHAYE